jgi:protein phosphatase/serine/threonine-protein phosphatase Stp1
MSWIFRSHAATDTGTVRKHNEDAFADCPELALWAVADGAGGHAAGEVASAMLVDAIRTIPVALAADETLTQLRLRVAAVNLALRGEALQRGANAVVASTIVALLIRGGHFVCLWVGDSRAYLLRNGALARISTDHSLVQELIAAGAITEAQAESHPQANVSTRAIGAPDDSGEMDKVTGAIAAGDRFLLCSDGVTKALPDEVLAGLLANAEADPARALIDHAMQAGSRDNVTAIIVDVIAEQDNS